MSGNYRVCTCTCNEAASMTESLSITKPIKHQQCKYETCLSLQDEQYTVYATTAGSPYVYRNFTVCTQCTGDNEMRGLQVK